MRIRYNHMEQGKATIATLVHLIQLHQLDKKQKPEARLQISDRSPKVDNMRGGVWAKKITG